MMDGRIVCTIEGMRHDQCVLRWPVPKVSHDAMIDPTYHNTLNWCEDQSTSHQSVDPYVEGVNTKTHSGS